MFFGGDPFAEHFAHGGGGGGRRSAGRRSASNVDTTKLYETLGVEKDADAKDIKKAYRKAAIKHHPDKGGDEQVFKEVNAGELFTNAAERIWTEDLVIFCHCIVDLYNSNIIRYKLSFVLHSFCPTCHCDSLMQMVNS